MALCLACVGTSQAMSTFVSMTIEPQWPTSANPGNVVLYKVTVVREGSGLLEVALSSAGLPAGSIVEFSPSLLRLTGHVPTVQTAMMRVTCPQPTATDTYEFTVTGEARRQTITVTNQFRLPQYIPVVARPVLFIDRLGDGTLGLRGQGSTGRTYTIETTATLGDPVWTPLGTCTADGNGRFSFFPTQTPDQPTRFYRAVELAP